MNKSVTVSILIVNYNGGKLLSQVLDSIFQQDYESWEVIIVDNNSTDESKEYLSALVDDRVSVISLDENVGFARANNLAADVARGTYLLFLNSDAFLTAGAIRSMVNVLESRKLVAGVAPKIYLYSHLPMKIFDSIGICMDFFGSPYNRGIGQIDLGQYDKEEEIMGLCFACCLVRKDLFLKNGGLDVSYFAYFEDVDWCFRTRKEGYSFLSCPNSVVHHMHSATTSRKSYAWKYHLIFRNYLRTAIKCFSFSNIRHTLKRKIRDLLYMLIFTNLGWSVRLSVLKVLVNFFAKDIWVYIVKRREIRRNFSKNVTDESIFQFSATEPSTFFDPVNYSFKVDMIMLEFIVLRLLSNAESNPELYKEWDVLKKQYYACLDPNWPSSFLRFHNKIFKGNNNYSLLQMK